MKFRVVAFSTLILAGGATAVHASGVGDSGNGIIDTIKLTAHEVKEFGLRVIDGGIDAAEDVLEAIHSAVDHNKLGKLALRAAGVIEDVLDDADHELHRAGDEHQHPPQQRDIEYDHEHEHELAKRKTDSDEFLWKLYKIENHGKLNKEQWKQRKVYCKMGWSMFDNPVHREKLCKGFIKSWKPEKFVQDYDECPFPYDGLNVKCRSMQSVPN